MTDEQRKRSSNRRLMTERTKQEAADHDARKNRLSSSTRRERTLVTWTPHDRDVTQVFLLHCHLMTAQGSTDGAEWTGHATQWRRGRGT